MLPDAPFSSARLLPFVPTIVSAARSLTCRDDLDSKWQLLLAENELLRTCIFTVSMATRRCCRSSLSRRFSTFQLSRNDQAIFLSLKIPLARLTDVSKVVNRNRRPRKLFIFFFLSSSLREPSAVLSETMTDYQTSTETRVHILGSALACVRTQNMYTYVRKNFHLFKASISQHVVSLSPVSLTHHEVLSLQEEESLQNVL